MRKPATVHAIDEIEDRENALLDRVFLAPCDPVSGRTLERLDHGSLLVSELAAPFAISLQAVSRHIQVLVRAGLVRQGRTGRISRCSREGGPISAAAVWLNRYSKYWQAQFDLLAAVLTDTEARGSRKPARTRKEDVR